MNEDDKKDDAESALVDTRDSTSVIPEQNEIAKQYVQEGAVDNPLWYGTTEPYGTTGVWGAIGVTGPIGATGPRGPQGVQGVPGDSNERLTTPDLPVFDVDVD